MNKELEPKKVKKAQTNPIFIYSALAFGALVLDIILLFVSINTSKTIQLEKKELTLLEMQEKQLTDSESVYNAYKDQFTHVSDVFPTEATIAEFIANIESILKGATDEFSFKFSTFTPVVENDLSYLPAVITMKTDSTRLTMLLQALEKLPHMTHITSFTSKQTDGKLDAVMGVAVYVQNPFTTK